MYLALEGLKLQSSGDSLQPVLAVKWIVVEHLSEVRFTLLFESKKELHHGETFELFVSERRGIVAPFRRPGMLFIHPRWPDL